MCVCVCVHVCVRVCPCVGVSVCALTSLIKPPPLVFSPVCSRLPSLLPLCFLIYFVIGSCWCTANISGHEQVLVCSSGRMVCLLLAKPALLLLSVVCAFLAPPRPFPPLLFVFLLRLFVCERLRHNGPPCSRFDLYIVTLDPLPPSLPLSPTRLDVDVVLCLCTHQGKRQEGSSFASFFFPFDGDRSAFA